MPQPILKACLDEMYGKSLGNPFVDDSDDDDEDEKPKKTKKSAAPAASSGPSDDYSRSLHLKEGRNAQTSLFYVDYTKLANNGNGLLPEDKNELYSNLEKSKCELDALNAGLKQTNSETARLLSEPTNDELATELVKTEAEMEELNGSLEASRSHSSNEKHVKQLKKRVATMAAYWRKSKYVASFSRSTLSLLYISLTVVYVFLSTQGRASALTSSTKWRKWPRVPLLGRNAWVEMAKSTLTATKLQSRVPSPLQKGRSLV